ncbi:Pro-neuregulin-1, membrane-bound isoform [Labeo rohita]|uniref:Pro-neuregulin-1, membrane-bound isoform n=1 Tax=Labeo rohita TaxID=84645 RepID=A0ABQ8MB65_LABRO|nr:Pro-neuregulin-1, membrane-bound isoform [Labeo rohita]
MSEKSSNKEGKSRERKKDKSDKSDISPQAEPKLKDLRSVTVEDGKKTVLKCEIVAGNPAPSIKWYKNGKELTGKNKPKSIKIKKKKQGKISELLIRKSTEADAGLYTCEAINSLGKTNTTASLTISKSKNASFLQVLTSIMCKSVASDTGTPRMMAVPPNPSYQNILEKIKIVLSVDRKPFDVLEVLLQWSAECSLWRVDELFVCSGHCHATLFQLKAIWEKLRRREHTAPPDCMNNYSMLSATHCTAAGSGEFGFYRNIITMIN